MILVAYTRIPGRTQKIPVPAKDEDFRKCQGGPLPGTALHKVVVQVVVGHELIRHIMDPTSKISLKSCCGLTSGMVIIEENVRAAVDIDERDSLQGDARRIQDDAVARPAGNQLTVTAFLEHPV